MYENRNFNYNILIHKTSICTKNYYKMYKKLLPLIVTEFIERTALLFFSVDETNR